jgi:hypothetical protein
VISLGALGAAIPSFAFAVKYSYETGTNLKKLEELKSAIEEKRESHKAITILSSKL